MRNAKIWRWIALLALGVVLAGGLLYVGLQDRASKQERAEVLRQAEPLERQRDELVARRDRLEREFYESFQGQGTEQLLFLELDPLLMEEVFPALQERQIPGVLGLYEGNFPGDAGTIGREEVQRLLDAGWELCLVFRGGGDFAAWDADMTKRLEEGGLTKPTALYFSEGAYDPSLEQEILHCGYETVVQHNESRTVKGSRDVDGPLWLAAAHPWNYAGVKEALAELAGGQGEHCYTVSFRQGREEYESKAFASMLDYVEPFRQDGSLVITGFVRARQMHDPEQNGKQAAEDAWRQQDRDRQQQIQDLNRQIQQIYEQWKGGRDD